MRYITEAEVLVSMIMQKRLTTHRAPCKSPLVYLAVVLLSQSADIQTNPSPVKYPCQICNKAVKWTTPGVCCDSCDGWYHKDCMGMNSAVYEGLTNISWYCCSCGLPNFSTTLFDTVCLDDTNPFSPLSDMHSSVIPSSPESPVTDIGSPTAASSPKQHHQKHKRNGRKDVPLKVAVINCRSIVNKRAEIANLIDSTHVDVIVGTESWLTPEIQDSEVCPPGYNMFRKDRAQGRGGGVLILISKDYISSDPGIPVPNDVEMVWAQVQEVGSKALNICSFYRPPNKDDKEYLDALSKG